MTERKGYAPHEFHANLLFRHVLFHEKTHFPIFAGSGILPNMIKESIHTKDESKRGFAFAFIFGVN